MRQGCRDDQDPAGLIHLLNQRYRQEFDRAERLRAELVAIQGSRLWPWFTRLRRWGRWWRTPWRRQPFTTTHLPPAWCQPFEPVASEPLFPRQVSIVIPFRDQPELLAGCMQSLHRTSTDLEIVLVDNRSTDPRIQLLLKTWEAKSAVTLVTRAEPFNFARLCNAGARAATRDVLLFLNNDVVAPGPDWLPAMLAVLADPRVGIVGATLWYPDQTLQHAGLAPTGPNGAWEHPYRGYPADHPGEAGELLRCRTVPAVTGACLMIRRQLFAQWGGFDERLAVTMNDVDLCQRARQAGRDVVVTPHAHLWHFESLSRGYQREAA